MDCALRLKARLVLHGNRDKEMFTVQHDSSSANFSVVRLLISLTTLSNSQIPTSYVKETYMQSGIIQRDIYGRLPKLLTTHKPSKWKLDRFSYNILEAKRQLLCAVETWLLDSYKLYIVSSKKQNFYKGGNDDMIELLVAKVVDDFLVSKLEDSVDRFLRHLRQRLGLGNI